MLVQVINAFLLFWLGYDNGQLADNSDTQKMGGGNKCDNRERKSEEYQ